MCKTNCPNGIRVYKPHNLNNQMLSPRPKHILALLVINCKSTKSELTSFIVKESESDGKVKGNSVPDSHEITPKVIKTRHLIYICLQNAEPSPGTLHLSYLGDCLHPVGLLVAVNIVLSLHLSSELPQPPCSPAMTNSPISLAPFLAHSRLDPYLWKE